MVDNLVAQKRIRPVALAMIENRADARGVEYACNEGTVGFLLHSVLPLAQTHLNLLDVEASPGAYGILGASAGGLMALYAALRAPQVFGHVLSQSGAFGFAGYDFVVFDLVRDGRVKPLRIWMDVGRFEDLRTPNRRMHELLAAKGYDVTYIEYNGGHNYPAWRNDVWRGLEALFGTED
jgi:enterochelin esterase family protein